MKNNEIEDLLDQIFRTAQMQFGTAIKGRWLHDGDGCPGCGKEITVTKYKKQDALSLNAFLFREHGVLIGYMLCGKCATHILREAEKRPYGKLAIHDVIERNLKDAFVKHRGTDGMSTKQQFGMIGLGTMGRNFLLNVAEHGISGIGYNKHHDKLELLMAERGDMPVTGVDNVPEFIDGLEKPRRIMLLVPAGDAVDSVIADLMPYLEAGDIVIDGGNSHFTDTERREAYLNEKGISFLGVGVSGGEEGARHGASIMVGGDPAVYEHVRPIFEAASAKVNGEPCAAHVGKGSAGHFVKMVHNGIEYGLMQLIAETYDLLKRGYRMSTAEIADLFAEWNAGELNSFLMEISSVVLRKIDADSGQPLVDLILDTAGQKGTGKWTSQVAMDLGVPIPTIDSAVTMRQISARKMDRIAAAKKLGIVVEELSVDEELRSSTIEFVREGLQLAFIVTYAQGLSLLRAASTEKHYEVDMVEIARIWRGGCIIRAALLEDIRKAYESEPGLDNLLVSDAFVPAIQKKHALLKAFVHFAASTDIACMSAAASLNYLKAFATERLPANLIQAQRDFFGAHTYQRLGSEEVFHTVDWER